MITKINQDEIQNYLVDAANVKGFCEKVIIPESINELVEIVKSCNDSKVQITISGNGTGLTGGRVPQGGLVISMEKLNKILSIDTEILTVKVEAGVILSDLQNILSEKELLYPPDPTEKNCFIGATIATNASGARTFKYGPTRDYVFGLKIVLPDGEILNLQRGRNIAKGSILKIISDSGKIYSLNIPEIKIPSVKNAAGYFCHQNMDAIDIFIGSEGTLGIILEAELRLVPLDKKLLSAVAFFDDEKNALNFIAEARYLTKYGAQSDIKMDARALEFFDYFSLKFLMEDYPNIPESAKAAVWIEQELSENEDEITELWIELLLKHNGDEENSWFAFDRKEQEKFKDFRHAISWKVSDYISKENITKVGTDIAVPDEEFENFYFNAKSIVEQNGLKYVVYGHFGNSHLHLNMLPSADEFKKAKEIYKELIKNSVALKGTISAEHGIGKLKKEYFRIMYDEESINKMVSLKLSIDPNGILNKGNIFDF